jgi:hypothetical protein
VIPGWLPAGLRPAVPASTSTGHAPVWLDLAGVGPSALWTHLSFQLQHAVACSTHTVAERFHTVGQPLADMLQAAHLLADSSQGTVEVREQKACSSQRLVAGKDR